MPEYLATVGGALRHSEASPCASSPPGTWNQVLASTLGASPSRPVAEIAIYPDVAWLAARSLPEHSTSYRQAS